MLLGSPSLISPMPASPFPVHDKRLLPSRPPWLVRDLLLAAACTDRAWVWPGCRGLARGRETTTWGEGKAQVTATAGCPLPGAGVTLDPEPGCWQSTKQVPVRVGTGVLAESSGTGTGRAHGLICWTFTRSVSCCGRQA